MTDKKHLVFGLHSVSATLTTHPERIISLYVSKDRTDGKLNQFIDAAKKAHIPVEKVALQVLNRMTQEANHQGIAAWIKREADYTEADLANLLQRTSKPAFILILDGVQDPHNLGACFRSADAAGADLIIAPKDNAVGITPIVTKVASGGTESVPFLQVTNLVRTMEKLKEAGVWLYGADANAQQTLYQTDLSGPIALVMGAEGAGLRRLTKEHCDLLVKIPMQGQVASLNISVAAALFLFEVVRQRN